MSAYDGARKMRENSDVPANRSELTFLELIGEGSSSRVYRCRRVDDSPDSIFAVKLQKADAEIKTQDLKAQFRKEAAHLSRIKSESVVKIFEVGEKDSLSYIVMENIVGKTLSEVLDEGPLGEEATIELATKLCGALIDAHSIGVVHLDIKPENIIRTTSGYKLIDFGLAAQSADETRVNKEKIVGTLFYSSAEQLRILDTPIDERSDLFSLGCVLFECLTGRCAFQAGSISELLDLHVKGYLPAFAPADVSPALQGIVHKLLAKDPDSRYQTAAGLFEDIRSLLALNEEMDKGASCTFGSHDPRIIANRREILFGREGELQALRMHFDETKKSNGRAIFIEGDAGLGKSSLVREFMGRCATTGNVLVIGGKAKIGDALQATPLKEAFKAYVTQLSLMPAEMREAKETNLREAVGEYRDVLKSFSPVFKKFFGAADVDVDHPPYTQDILVNAVVKLFIEISRQFPASIFVMDDIQWVDEFTLEVLNRISLQIGKTGILLLCLSRNDSASLEALTEARARLSSTGAVKASLLLRPLASEDVHAMMEHFLKSSEVNDEIVELLMLRGAGNPLATDYFARTMLDEGVIVPHWGSWYLDRERLGALNLPEDVINLILSRLDSLSEDVREVLRIAAMIGSVVSVDLLMEVTGRKKDAVARAIGEAMNEKLIEKKDAHTIAFVHDRIFEALSKDVSGDAAREIHDRIANQLILRVEAIAADDDLIFAISHHLRMGTVGARPHETVRYTKLAGLLALKLYMNEKAFGLLQECIQLAGQFGLPEDRETILKMASACMLTFRLQEAMTYFDRALEQTSNADERSAILSDRAMARLTGYDISGAWQDINQALREKRRPLPQSVLGMALSTVVIAGVDFLFHGLKINKILARRNSKRREELVDLYNVACLIAPLQHQMLLPVVAVRGVFLARAIADGIAKAKAYSHYVLLLEKMGSKSTQWFFDEAIRIATREENRIQIAETTFLRMWSFTTSGKIDDVLRTAAELKTKHSSWMHPRAYFDVFWACGHILQLKGQSPKAIAEVEELMFKTKNSKNSSAIYDHFSPAFWAILLTWSGRVSEAAAFLNKLRAQLSKHKPNKILGGDVLSALLMHYYETREFGARYEEALKEFGVFRQDPRFAPSPMWGFYIGRCSIEIARALELPLAERRMSHPRIRAAIRELSLLSAGAPLFVPFLMLFRGGEQYAKGRYPKALKYLNAALALAVEQESNFVIFETLQMRADVYKAMGYAKSSELDLHTAYVLAAEQGWRKKTERLEQRHDLRKWAQAQLRGAGRTMAATFSQTGQISKGAAGEHSGNFIKRYLDALLRVSSAAAQTSDPTEQVRLALDEIISVLGCERAFVFSVNSDASGLDYNMGRSDDRKDVENLTGYSSTVVSKVFNDRQELIVTGTDQGEALGSQSAVLFNLRSIMAAPMILNGIFKGVIYVDSKVAKGIFSQDDVKVLTGIANHISVAFEAAKLARLEVERKEIEMDLKIGAAVQSLLLPAKNEFKHPKYNLSCQYIPATSCSGDLWWQADVGPNRTLVFVGDVTGHGVGPAMISATVVSHLHALIKARTDFTPERILSELSGQLGSLVGDKFWMTAFLGLFDFEQGKLFAGFSGCPAIIKIADGQLEHCGEVGAPLGGVDTTVGTGTYELRPGTRFIVMTDGIVEAKLRGGAEFGLRRLTKLFLANATEDTSADASQVIAKVKELVDPDIPQEDDFTLLFIDIK